MPTVMIFIRILTGHVLRTPPPLLPMLFVTSKMPPTAALSPPWKTAPVLWDQAPRTHEQLKPVKPPKAVARLRAVLMKMAFVIAEMTLLLN